MVQRNSVMSPGEVNGRVSEAERTQLRRAFCLAIEQSGYKPHRLWCLGCSAVMCTEFRSWVWRISKTESVPAGLVSINKAIDQWRSRLKTVIRVHGRHIEQLFT